MSDERRRVLDLLAQGKITTDQAEQLLQALDRPPQAAEAAPNAEDGEKPKPRYLRIAVRRPATEHHSEEDVNIRVPIAIVRAGMRLGAMIPTLAGERVSARLREKGLDVDLSKLDPAMIESMLKELGELNVDIDSGKGQVRITCE